MSNKIKLGTQMKYRESDILIILIDTENNKFRGEKGDTQYSS